MPLSHMHPGLRPGVAVSSQASSAAPSSSSPGGEGSNTSSTATVADRSTLLLSYAPTPATAAGAATSLVQNYASSIVAWSDVFDVHAVPCDAWWLRGACADDGSELCVGDVDQLRTMSGRLARAAQLAGSGGKWGLLQAVLLSWDSVPASAQSWVLQQIALEACGLLILPAAAEGLQADLKAAWEALPGKEQQLWCQLQQARLLHSRQTQRPFELTYYTMDEYTVASLLQHATGVAEAGALLAEPAMCNASDPDALNMFSDAATRRRNMDASYTALRLCCRVYGTSHPRTREALEDTRVTDPQGWVPLLLAGLAYPSLSRAPGVLKGSKEEAEAYVHRHGWSWVDPPRTGGELWMSHYGPHLSWLLKQRGMQLPSKEQQADLCALRRLNCGQTQLACNAALNLTNPLGGYVHLGLELAVREMGLVAPLRACLVKLGCAFLATYNLPPLDAAPQHWGSVAEILKMEWDGKDLYDLRENVYCHIIYNHSMALDLLAMVPRMTTLVPQAKGGFWRAAELGEMQAFLSAAASSMCRVYWQLGLVEVAQSLADTGFEEQRSLERNKPSKPGSTPVRQPGTAPWKAIQNFLSQQQQQVGQTAAAGTGAGGSLSTGTSNAGRHTISTSSSRGYTGPAPRREHPMCCYAQVTFPREPLFDAFPGWLDQLVSQVVGRPVKLAVDVEILGDDDPLAMFMHTAPDYLVEVYMVEADGSRTPFSWQAQPSGLPAAAATTSTISGSRASSTATTAAPSSSGAASIGRLAASLGAGHLGDGGSSHNSQGTGSSQPPAVPSLDTWAAMLRQCTIEEVETEPGAIMVDGERLIAAVAAMGLADQIPGLAELMAHEATPAGQRAPSQPPQQYASSTQMPAAAAGSRAQAGGGRGGREAAAAQPPPAAHRATSGAAARVDDTGMGPAGGGGGGASSAAGDSSEAAVGGSNKKRPCAMCGQLFTKLQRCGKCKKVLYCSREHQVAHWKAVHKLECKEQPSK